MGYDQHCPHCDAVWHPKRGHETESQNETCERNRYRRALERIAAAKPSNYKPAPYPGGVAVVFASDLERLQEMAREELER